MPKRRWSPRVCAEASTGETICSAWSTVKDHFEHEIGYHFPMTTGTAPSPELLVELDRSLRRPLRAQLEDGLRDAVRSGRLSAGTRLPASRTLANDLEISRRMVVDAYAQLLAEGYLVARGGAGTYVAAAAAAAPAAPEEQLPRALAFDFFPGYPD